MPTSPTKSKSKVFSSRHSIKLYYLPPSPPCRAVIMTAGVLGIDLDLVVTNLMEGEEHAQEFIRINPQHSIPTMDDNGFILWESRAIMTYLVNAYGSESNSLYPKDPRLRAIVDQRLNFDLGTLFMRYNNLYAPMIMTGAPINEEKAAKLNEAIGWLNSMLEGKAFVAGDHMTLADISIVVTFTNLAAFGHDFSQFENVTTWFEITKVSLEPYGYREVDVEGAEMLAQFMKGHHS